MTTIGGLFGRSPAGPLEELALKTQRTCELIPAVIDYMIARELDSLRETYGEMTRLESEVDDIKDAIRLKLSPSLFTAIKRLQVLDAVARIEEIADRAESVGRMLTYRQLVIPLASQPSLRELSQLCRDCGERMANTVGAYRIAEQQEFADKSLDELYESAREVSDAEDEAEAVEDSFQRMLFANETETEPVSVILLMQLCSRLDAVCSACENAADAMVRMAMKK